MDQELVEPQVFALALVLLDSQTPLGGVEDQSMVEHRDFGQDQAVVED